MKKGFTIVELLAVIIIISVLVTLVGISVSNIVKKSKKQMNDIQKKEVIAAAKNYMSDNIGIEINEDECKYISLETLQNQGFIENIEEFENVYIKIELDNSKQIPDYKYAIADSVGDCVEIN